MSIKCKKSTKNLNSIKSWAMKNQKGWYTVLNKVYEFEEKKKKEKRMMEGGGQFGYKVEESMLSRRDQFGRSENNPRTNSRLHVFSHLSIILRGEQKRIFFFSLSISFSFSIRLNKICDRRFFLFLLFFFFLEKRNRVFISSRIWIVTFGRKGCL